MQWAGIRDSSSIKEMSIELITQDALDMSAKELTDDRIEEYVDCLEIECIESGFPLDKEAVTEFLKNRRKVK